MIEYQRQIKELGNAALAHNKEMQYEMMPQFGNHHLSQCLSLGTIFEGLLSTNVNRKPISAHTLTCPLRWWDRCCLCRNGVETNHHLFFKCSYSLLERQRLFDRNMIQEMPWQMTNNPRVVQPDFCIASTGAGFVTLILLQGVVLSGLCVLSVRHNKNLHLPKNV